MNLLSQLNRNKLNELVAKYGGAVPRYTSYPTAPEWKHDYNHDEFLKAIDRSNQTAKDYSLYLHIPFCESQCYYCGCNVVISPEHGIEQKYVDALKLQLTYLADKIDSKRRVVQMAWGGGTPTYLTPDQILDVFGHIQNNFSLYEEKPAPQLESAEYENFALKEHEYSIEIDPRVTSIDHLQVLKELGFNRLSLGVQDFNLQTQEAINRLQSFEQVEFIVSEARSLGFNSINFDLIYGLPFQTKETFKESIEKVKAIDPERIAMFNYAHIPSIFPFQNAYIKDESLPNQQEKMQIFDYAVQEFCDFGYEFIGIDHFAKPKDAMSIAQRNNTLYRNFQGYTTHDGHDLFSAGITAISDVAGVFKQNHKKLNDYYEEIFEHKYAAEKFFVSSTDDRTRRALIKDIMCQNQALIDTKIYAIELEKLQNFAKDGLISLDLEPKSGKYLLKVTELGRFLTRNIAAVFDTYLQKKAGHKLFSKSL